MVGEITAWAMLQATLGYQQGEKASDGKATQQGER
jgi:hypothetical protein